MESKIEWHYLPEMPYNYCIVLVSVKYDSTTYVCLALYYDNVYSEYGTSEYESLEDVYAWAYLPQPAEVK